MKNTQIKYNFGAVRKRLKDLVRKKANLMDNTTPPSPFDQELPFKGVLITRLFWKYAVNLQKNTRAKVRFQ